MASVIAALEFPLTVDGRPVDGQLEVLAIKAAALRLTVTVFPWLAAGSGVDTHGGGQRADNPAAGLGRLAQVAVDAFERDAVEWLESGCEGAMTWKPAYMAAGCALVPLLAASGSASHGMRARRLVARLAPLIGEQQQARVPAKVSASFAAACACLGPLGLPGMAGGDDGSADAAVGLAEVML